MYVLPAIRQTTSKEQRQSESSDRMSVKHFSQN